MTETADPTPSLADEMLAASRRRAAEYTPKIIIPVTPDTSKNRQRTGRRTQRRRCL